MYVHFISSEYDKLVILHNSSNPFFPDPGYPGRLGGERA